MGVIYVKRGRIAYVTINRPDAANALDGETADELETAWIDFRDDPNVWIAILTGAGERAFCAGADLAKGMGPSNRMEETPGGLKSRIIFDLKGINIWKPIIAAVNGHAIGSGTEMLTGCDIRIAAPNATFGLYEVRYGQIPFGGSVVRLARQIPYCHAMKLLMTGQRIDAAEALRIGLVNEVVPLDQLMSRCEEIADQILDNAPLAIRSIKEVVIRSQGMSLEQAYAVESLYGERLGHTDDSREGPKALAERRRPEWQAR